MELHTAAHRLPPNDAGELLKRLGRPSPGFLLESLSVSVRYGRLSLAGVEPILELKAEGAQVRLRLLEPRGIVFFERLLALFPAEATQTSSGEAVFTFQPEPFSGSEDDRFRRRCPASVIQALLAEFRQPERTFMGLYGALAYHFIYYYEDIPVQNVPESPAFHLFLYDTFVFYNHLTGESQTLAIRSDAAEAQAAADALAARVLAPAPETPDENPVLENARFDPEEADFIRMVGQARDLCLRGELVELVLARRLTARYEGDPLSLYRRYRAINPSPYLFFFDFGDHECLIGASPEMMLRYENGQVTLRPISGTTGRGKNPVEDHENMLRLLNSEKEKAELDMLVDLGRNDLARVCKPGVRIDDYRYVEKYAYVMHTVAQVSAQLEEQYTGFDALIASLNAGTLTGAPKVAAMRHIEEIEPYPRNYYGGAIGYFSLSGEVDTGIIIRTAHLKQGRLEYLSGATLLYDSMPEAELEETRLKAAAFMRVFQ